MNCPLQAKNKTLLSHLCHDQQNMQSLKTKQNPSITKFASVKYADYQAVRMIHVFIFLQLYNNMNRQSFAKGQPFSPPLDHKIDMLCLSVLFVGFFSCLIRSDYNFAIIFFCYFIWQQRKDLLSLRLIMASIITLFLFDFIFIFTEMRLWNQTDENNPVWQTIRPLHGFAIFCFIVINLLKIALLVFVGKGIAELNKSVQTR